MCGFVSHFQSLPRGRIVRKAVGLAYWFSLLSAAVVQVPAEHCETTFVLNERCSDFQHVVVQCTVTHRLADHERAITENALATELELAKRQETLIRQQGANSSLQAGEDSEADSEARSSPHASALPPMRDVAERSLPEFGGRIALVRRILRERAWIVNTRRAGFPSSV